MLLTGEKIELFNKIGVRRKFAKDFCDLARFCIWIVGVLRRIQVCQFVVPKDCAIHCSHSLGVCRCFTVTIDDF